MENGRWSGQIKVAAAAAGEVGFCPLTSTGKFLITKVTEYVNVGIVANDTDYVTRTPYGGTTAIATGKTTQATGGAALTTRTAVNYTLTGNDSSCEVTQANPFNFRVAHSSAGKAYDCTIEVEYIERAP